MHGRCVSLTWVVANHPFGAVDGLIMGDILTQSRPDFRMLANRLLYRIPGVSRSLRRQAARNGVDRVAHGCQGSGVDRAHRRAKFLFDFKQQFCGSK